MNTYVKFGLLIAVIVGTLAWHDGTLTSADLDKDPDPSSVERVKYLPQSYLEELCNELAKETGNEDLEVTADVIQRVIWEEKQLPPNLDWPSGRLYHYMNLPVELYTPLFVLSRVAGWSAHIIEQLDNNRLIRPRARYTGPERRAWKPIASR